MKRFLFAIVCVVFLASCNDEIELANRIEEHIFLEDKFFSGVGVQDGFELYLTNDGSDSIKIISDVNVNESVKYEIKNGILYFYKEPDTEFPSEVLVKIYVSKDSLKTVKALSSKVHIIDTLRTKTIDLVFSGNSVLTGSIKCEKLQSVINHSTIGLTGISDTVQMNISGGSSVKLFDLVSDNAKVNISGGSLAEITVNKELEVKAIERSSLHYRGTTVIRSKVSDDDSEIKTP
jgi:hypothetical protein